MLPSIQNIIIQVNIELYRFEFFRSTAILSSHAPASGGTPFLEVVSHPSLEPSLQ